MTGKIESTKEKFIENVNNIKKRLQEELQAKRDNQRQSGLSKEIISNTERTHAPMKHANESKAALDELKDMSGKMRGRAGYENIESCMANIAEFAMILYRFLKAERDGFIAQFNQNPIVRDIPILNNMPDNLIDFLEIDNDGRLDLTKLKDLAGPDKHHLDLAVTKFLKSNGYNKTADNAYKTADGVKLTPETFELLGSIEKFVENLPDEDFTPRSNAPR